jgi:hypothetical protein
MNQGFSYYFCLMKKGSGAGPVPRINGSGSGMPKNIRIRIRNTGISRLERRKTGLFFGW